MTAATLLALSLLGTTHAAARFSTVFAPHMVLQRGQPVRTCVTPTRFNPAVRVLVMDASIE